MLVVSILVMNETSLAGRDSNRKAKRTTAADPLPMKPPAYEALLGELAILSE
jgi:hypothetical protein